MGRERLKQLTGLWVDWHWIMGRWAVFAIKSKKMETIVDTEMVGMQTYGIHGSSCSYTLRDYACWNAHS